MKKANYKDSTFNRNLGVLNSLEQGLSPEEVANSFNISVSTIYRIRKLAKHGGIYSIAPKSKAPKTKPERDKLVIKFLLDIRRKIGFGSEKIYDYLIRHSIKFGLDKDKIPKPRTIHNILRQKGYIKVYKSGKRLYKPDYYKTRAKNIPNHIVETDMKIDHYLEKKPVIVNGYIDICSKVITVGISGSKTTENSLLNLIEHVYRWGLPSIIKTDNDMCYLGQIEGSSFGKFTRFCLYLGIKQIIIPIHSPRWNPFIERFFRTWDENVFNRSYHNDRADLKQKNNEFVEFYLTDRSHQGLRDLPNNPDKIKMPAEYHQRYAKIIKPISSRKNLIQLVKSLNIPIVKGVFSFIRKLPESGIIKFKQNKFYIPKSYVGMMIKGTVFVEPDKDHFKVEFYFREHKIVSSVYNLKKYEHSN